MLDEGRAVRGAMRDLSNQTPRLYRVGAPFALATSLGALVVVVASCTGEPEWCEGHATTLAAADYALLSIDEDPYFDATDTGVTRCALVDDVRVETLGVEPSVTVETTYCNHATLAQPLPVVVHEGERVHVRLWYFSQTSFEGTMAHVRFRFGDDEVLAVDVPIPAESGLISEDVIAPREYPVGTPVLFHVGNHGDNSWNLLEISPYPRAPCPE